MRVSLVIPAAGRGQRFGSETPKQLLRLCGLPVIAHSLAAFARLVDEAVLAVDLDSRDLVQAAIDESPLPYPVRLVAGGATRQASVAAAVRATDPMSAVVLVHDAVRPLITPRCITACLSALVHHDAAVVAVPCSATVKRVTGSRSAGERPDGADVLVEATVPREHLWLAQTPQGFRRQAGLDAFARAERDGWQCSDDAQVLERAGIAVAVVMGDARNIKITTRDDWALAEALMRALVGQPGSP
jgi:2-C-methyl-D-erythritol 4-phosphate cytidylyltransferase